MTAERMNALTAFTNVAVFVAIVGGVWMLGGSMARLEAGVEHNATAIEKNAAAIAKLQDAVAENGKAIARLAAAMERLAGQLAEHIRQHEALASH